MAPNIDAGSSDVRGMLQSRRVYCTEWFPVVVAISATSLLCGCGPDLPISERLTSYQEMRYAKLVRQRFDFTCGAAALATLLNYFYGAHITEGMLLEMLRKRYTAAQWKAKSNSGLSFEDLSYLTAKLGYASAGARVGLAGLTRLKGPVIVHLRRDKFDHFSVLKGISGDRAFLADSIFGNERMRIENFLEIYTGAALAVWKEGETPPLDYPLKVAPNFTPPEAEVARETLYETRQYPTNKPF